MVKDIAGKVGMAFAPYSFVVESGKIREFALAIGDDNPIYFEVEQARANGFSNLPIPPTFATVMDMWAGPDFDTLCDRLEVNPLRVLHGEMQYSYLGDICAGDELRAAARVTNAAVKKGMNLFTIETKYVNQQGETVLVAQSVLIERHESGGE